MKKSVETQLIDFLAANPSVFASAQLQRMFWRNKNGTIASPRSVVRRLEENTYTPDNLQGVLEVSYIGGNAHYKIREEHKKKPRTIIDLDTLPPIKINGRWVGQPIIRKELVSL